MTKEYKVKFYDRNGVAEEWFATRDERSLFILTELRGATDVIGWEDPASDFNGANVYGPGKDMRGEWS
jgi:hypothetical protein